MFTDEILQLSEKILHEAKSKNIKISCAESCTGGLVGAALTEIAGSSEIFNGSAVVYSNEAKNKILNVSQDILNNFGAVSSECAVSMAEGSRKIYNSHFAISLTGIAGPDGGSELKPVGTVWFGISSDKKESYAVKKIFSGDRAEIRESAVKFALNKILEEMK